MFGKVRRFVASLRDMAEANRTLEGVDEVKVKVASMFEEHREQDKALYEELDRVLKEINLKD